MDETQVEMRSAGFRLADEEYRWFVSDRGVDLILIDRITEMPVQRFFQELEASQDDMRGPLLLALIACSIRHKHPEWSTGRIVRTVMDLSLDEDLEIIAGDEGKAPAEASPEASPTPSPTSSESPVTPSAISSSSPSSSGAPGSDS